MTESTILWGLGLGLAVLGFLGRRAVDTNDARVAAVEALAVALRVDVTRLEVQNGGSLARLEAIEKLLDGVRKDVHWLVVRVAGMVGQGNSGESPGGSL